MAHRDIPVVFHHINFTPALPLFPRRDEEKIVERAGGGWVKEIARRKEAASEDTAGKVNLDGRFLSCERLLSERSCEQTKRGYLQS